MSPAGATRSDKLFVTPKTGFTCRRKSPWRLLRSPGFRTVIAAASESEIHDDVTLGDRLTLARDADTEIDMAYAPFEHVVPTAKVAIVGITPWSPAGP